MSFFNLIISPSIHFSSIVNSKWRPFTCGTDICQKTTAARTSCEFAYLMGLSCVIVGMEVTETKLPVFVETKTPQLSKGCQHQREPKTTTNLPDLFFSLENFEWFLNSHVLDEIYTNLTLSLCFLIFLFFSIVQLTPFHTISICRRGNWSVGDWYFLAFERDFYMFQCFSLKVFEFDSTDWFSNNPSCIILKRGRNSFHFKFIEDYYFFCTFRETNFIPDENLPNYLAHSIGNQRYINIFSILLNFNTNLGWTFSLWCPQKQSFELIQFSTSRHDESPIPSLFFKIDLEKNQIKDIFRKLWLPRRVDINIFFFIVHSWSVFLFYSIFIFLWDQNISNLIHITLEIPISHKKLFLLHNSFKRIQYFISNRMDDNLFSFFLLFEILKDSAEIFLEFL